MERKAHILDAQNLNINKESFKDRDVNKSESRNHKPEFLKY